jgi:hypothetical protein
MVAIPKVTSGDLLTKQAMRKKILYAVKYWNNRRTQQSIFGARFYCALLTLHVSDPFGGHLQVVRKHNKYLRQSLYIQRIR